MYWPVIPQARLPVTRRLGTLLLAGGMLLAGSALLAVPVAFAAASDNPAAAAPVPLTTSAPTTSTPAISSTSTIPATQDVAPSSGVVVSPAPAVSSLPVSSAPAAVPAAPTVYGWVEWASLEPEDLQLEAKFDTGAETSSLDADNLRLSERDGQEYATFELRASQGGHAVTRTLSYPVTRWVKIRSAAGVDRRPVVRIEVCVGTQSIDAEFSLRDRSDMTYQLLLGRRAIALFGPVDAGHTHLLGSCRLP